MCTSDSRAEGGFYSLNDWVNRGFDITSTNEKPNFEGAMYIPQNSSFSEKYGCQASINSVPQSDTLTLNYIPIKDKNNSIVISPIF